MAEQKTEGETAAPEKVSKGKKGAAGAVKKKKKVKKNVSEGIVHIHASFNNTTITIADRQGNVISWGTSGAAGFKGSKKSTPFAAQIASEEAAGKAREHGLRSVEVVINGPGAGRETALKALGMAGLQVTTIRDITPVPHNGCRPAKKRRV